MAQISPMNGGDDTFSYVKNSTLQRDGLIAAKDAIKEALTRNLDINALLLSTTTFTIADLGCSVGPNTFFAAQVIIETVEHTLSQYSPKKLEFQVCFNDLTTNDFNTLFASLPDHRTYLAAGVPGSFYGRLFPSSSIHVAYTSSSLHWLSRLPVELEDKKSPAWNPGRIHYTGGAPEAVVRAYTNQFEEDMAAFLRARSQEMAAGGMVVILMPGVPDGVLTHDVGIAITFLGSILMDMVKEGLLNQDQIDSFNFPHVYPCVEQMTRLVQKNGCFDIVKMELRNARPNPQALIDIEGAIMHVRAFTEGTIANHLGTQIVDQLFIRAFKQKTKFTHMLHSSAIQIGSQLFAVLKLN
ncbi:probable S-adenosylmethionine-dependent methyltransferase at5g38780 [Phtheirospermum japonicum]|uniref:Probable S-adenosylmethionine-dependent methyltransferase at5g38780 n=1 Tax=Phtheirospermum japonicum TaxID=374723 RepID=A0A830CLI2_9LAMI|nr:probable S-adenosylmethionine-dependent methyltransferase at5g38780 [Phtheirospermum japonicum]